MLTRRRFLALATLAVPAVGADASLFEPTGLCVRKLTLNRGGSLSFVHFTDFHFKGDTEYASKVIQAINREKPAFVCFSGDLVEDRRFAPAALGFIQQIKAPVYGAPGNHDYTSRTPFSEFHRAFSATGGEWLVDCNIILPQYDLEIFGSAMGGVHALGKQCAARRILLMHYPAMADKLNGQAFDLILAGHSHGGQVRIPFYGAPVLPWGVGPYDLGRFETKGGTLYVGSGIGTHQYDIRFNCRPEITVVTI
ncbi:MAG: metallophosphoesterase [Chthoniobacterales bacterium]